MDPMLVAKVLLTLVLVAQGFGPMRVDFNRTHATNPEWTPHARFHVVWQVLLQTGVSVLGLVLLWGLPSTQNTWIAGLVALNWPLTFFVTLAAMPRFEGSLKDEATGIPPFVLRFFGRRHEIDTNLFGAVVLTLLIVAALALLAVEAS